MASGAGAAPPGQSQREARREPRPLGAAEPMGAGDGAAGRPAGRVRGCARQRGAG